MEKRVKKFRLFVIIFVTLIGTGFGALTGFVYSESFWWVGMIVGVASSYHLAKWYLKQLTIICGKEYNRKRPWLSSTLVAMYCGIICTTLTHGAMTLIVYTFDSFFEPFWPLAVPIGELIGACAGLVAGGICSWVYIAKVIDKEEGVDNG